MFLFEMIFKHRVRDSRAQEIPPTTVLEIPPARWFYDFRTTLSFRARGRLDSHPTHATSQLQHKQIAKLIKVHIKQIFIILKRAQNSLTLLWRKSSR